MNPLDIINKYYSKDSNLYTLLIEHSQAVTKKALTIAHKHPELNADTRFISEAAMLHDIGIFKTQAPSIHCLGEYPYIAHGYLGSELLQQEGYPRHALVCERHTGTGISLDEIIKKNLPLPHRDMLPISIEEQIICFADKFYSKSRSEKEKSIDEIMAEMSKFGEKPIEKFKEWCNLFL